MENIVIAATITGFAAIIAATIQALGNISAAKHKLATQKPVQKEQATAEVTLRTTKRDWSFWVIFCFMILWWIQAMIFGDVFSSRNTLALVILMPMLALFMVTIKVVAALLRLK